MEEHLLKLMEIYQYQTELVDKGWQYFSIVTLGILGFTIGTEKLELRFTHKLLIVVGYIVFSVGNLIAILSAQRLAVRFTSLLNIEIQKLNLEPLIGMYKPFSVFQLAVFYISILIVVIGIVLYIGWERDGRSNKRLQPTPRKTRRS
ncbi:MAG: hypothetical protein WD823_12375 [Sulfuricaulis sp.]|uniref:hypothetical protein n=1 Tax=Sulfuricaulis sp. TaxID=2003553 RepID=UPI0034A35A31